jgi:hypothetical protein
METATRQTAYVSDKSWGWVVVFGNRETHKLGDGLAAEEFAAALNAGEEWRAAWDRLKMIRWVREQDGGTFRA